LNDYYSAIGDLQRMLATSLKFDSAAQEAYLGLWRTYDRLKTVEDQFFEPWNLTAQQYNVLRLLRAAGSEAVPTLSLVSRLVSKAPDVTRMLDRLEANQWIERERSVSDRRAVLVRITDAGRQLLDAMQEPLAKCHQDQLGHLSDDELETLSQLLRKARQPHEPTGSSWQ
jgi:DNA-binding MarR family transcriptional regulator